VEKWAIIFQHVKGFKNQIVGGTNFANRFHSVAYIRLALVTRLLEPLWQRAEADGALELPREAVESPSLDIFQPRLDKVLCSLLWVTLLQQGVGLGDPQRSLPTPDIL